jgi:hypothetical protein
VIELTNIWIERATRSTGSWIEKEIGLRLVSTEKQIWPEKQVSTDLHVRWNVRVIALIGNWIEEAIELIAGLIEKATELTRSSTAKATVRTGVCIARTI